MVNNIEKRRNVNIIFKFLLIMFLYYISYFGMAFAYFSLVGKPDETNADLIFPHFALKVILIILSYAFASYEYKNPKDFFGISLRKNNLKLFLIGCLIGVVQLIFIDGISLKLDLIGNFTLNSNIEMQSILKFLVYCILVGVGEEMLFRGYLLGSLLDKFTMKNAVLISSLIFAMIHFSSVDLCSNIFTYINIFLGGILYGYLYIVTKSLYLPIGLHSIYDFIQYIIVAEPSPFCKYLMKSNPPTQLIIGNYNFGYSMELVFMLTNIVMITIVLFYKNHKLQP